VIATVENPVAVRQILAAQRPANTLGPGPPAPPCSPPVLIDLPRGELLSRVHAAGFDSPESQLKKVVVMDPRGLSRISSPDVLPW
jgi:hypothetical protein